jgi:hypothetical protein
VRSKCSDILGVCVCVYVCMLGVCVCMYVCVSLSLYVYVCMLCVHIYIYICVCSHCLIIIIIITISDRINIYEFVSIFKDFSKTMSYKYQNYLDEFEDEFENSNGHLLSLSTVECAERIIHIYNGNGICEFMLKKINVIFIARCHTHTCVSFLKVYSF